MYIGYYQLQQIYLIFSKVKTTHVTMWLESRKRSIVVIGKTQFYTIQVYSKENVFKLYKG